MVVDDKILKWKLRLLDFSKRNRLLNFKDIKRSTLRIVEPDMVELFNNIVNKNDTLEFQLKDNNINALNFDIDNEQESFLTSIDVELKEGNVLTDKNDKDLYKTLHNIRQRARTAIQEQGINVLYIAFGFLEWTEVEYSSVILKSPIVLVPVTLTIESLMDPYKIKMLDDEIVINPILATKLENDFGIILDDIKDEEDLDIKAYLDYIKNLVASKEWKVTEDVNLSLFSFLKINMYKDMEKYIKEMSNHPIIKSIAGGNSDIESVPDDIIECRDFDGKIKPIETFQVLDADSSQQQAIIAANKGISFILQGPPGTGKSQTITNIIGECLASGKKILFVSEKMAALDVVYKRLEQVGLSDFCLQLHSHKANKKDVISELGRTLNLSKIKLDDNITDPLEQLYDIRNQLNLYDRILHKRNEPSGLSIYQIHSRLAKCLKYEDSIFDLYNPAEKSLSEINNYERLLDQLSQSLDKFGEGYSTSPWYNSNIEMLSFEKRNEIESRFNNFIDLLDSLVNIVEKVTIEFGLEKIDTLHSILRLYNILTLTEKSSQPPKRWFSFNDINMEINKILEFEEIMNKYYQVKNIIDKKYQAKVYSSIELDKNDEVNQYGSNILTVLNSNYAKDIDDLLLNRDDFIPFVYEVSTILEKIIMESDNITSILGLEPIKSNKDIHWLKELIDILMSNLIVTMSWFDNGRFNQAISFSILLEEKFSRLSEIKHIISNRYKDDIFNLDIEKIEEVFMIDYRSLFIRDNSSYSKMENDEDNNFIDVIIKNRERIYDLTSDIIIRFEDINEVTDEISTIIGVEIPQTISDIENLNILCSLINKNPNPEMEWFELGSIDRILRFASECELAFKRKIDLENDIYNKFDKDIINIQYKELLKRFKVEYSSTLRIFKSKYYKDVKEIKGYCKDIHSKNSTDDYIDILQKIKELHETCEWININQVQMKDDFGRLFNFEFTKWDELISALEVTKKIIEIFNGYPPIKLKEILLKSVNKGNDLSNHSRRLELLLNLNHNIEFITEWMQIDTIILKDEINAKEIKEWAFSIRDNTNALFKNYDSIHMLADDKNNYSSFNDIKLSISYVNEILRIQEWLNKNDDEIKELFGDLYKYEFTDWESINSTFSMFESLLRLFPNIDMIPERFKYLLTNNNNELANMNVIFNEFVDCFSRLKIGIMKYNEVFADNYNGIKEVDIRNLSVNLIKVKRSSSFIIEFYDNLSSMLKDNEYKIGFNELQQDVEMIINSNKILRSIQEKSSYLEEKYEHYYLGINTQWKEIRETFVWIKQLNEVNNGISFPEKFISIVCNNKETINKAKGWRQEIELILEGINSEIEYVEGLFNSIPFDLHAIKIKQVEDWLIKCIKSFDDLQNWIDLRRSIIRCTDSGLGSYMEYIKINQVKNSEVKGMFFKRFYKLWLDDVYSKSTNMASFRGINHEKTIEIFRELDKSQFEISRARIRETLSSKRPNPHSILSRGSEVTILQREMGKKRKILPLRRLFTKIPNLLFALKPCLLMSPLSVSLFVDPDYFKFDLVIFDEASQICTEDAIGSIFRANQCIIVGDREQLPPTNFFNASLQDTDFDNDDGYEEDDEDYNYESILDECGTVLNNLSLQWHYRSKHESLIAFSNAKIYRNLVTFPSATDNKEDFGVEYIEVRGGIYDRSITRANRVEAQAVAKLVFEHFDKYPNRSLGVVAFSGAQQDAIEAEIRKLRNDNIQMYDKYFNEDDYEGFFIKSLENVQGDERDTIIFSIGYGKDKNGIMHMNFGPLSKQGGYRRLNVAITRARYNVKLVGSIKPTDIDLSRTSSEGVKMLRQYIEFAINGTDALLNELIIPETPDFDSPFENEVYDALTKRGYKVDSQVGCSGYRIDLAVRHPVLSGIYILGIECDGATYHSARTARERDRLREEVLKSIGWDIQRIWSTDWVKNPDKEISRIIDTIETNIRNSELTNYDDINNIMEIDLDSNKDNERYIDLETEIPNNIDLDEIEIHEYIIANIKQVKREYGKTDIQYIKDVVEFIADIEGPIHFDLMAKRISPIFGNKRAGSSIKKSLKTFILSHCKNSVVLKGDFIWQKSMDTPNIRRASGKDSMRSIEHISVEEIGEAMVYIVTKSVGINKSNLFSDTARLFGFNRTGEKIYGAMEMSLNTLLKESKLDINNDTVSIHY